MMIMLAEDHRRIGDYCQGRSHDGEPCTRRRVGGPFCRSCEEDGGHHFRRTIPTDGTWCQHCGLSSSAWTGTPCPGFDPRTTLRDMEAVFVARYASRRELMEENDLLRANPPMVKDLLALALEIDHPDHYNNEEHAETCRTCHGWTGLRASWPCAYHEHAEAIRKIAQTKETPA